MTGQNSPHLDRLGRGRLAAARDRVYGFTAFGPFGNPQAATQPARGAAAANVNELRQRTSLLLGCTRTERHRAAGRAGGVAHCEGAQQANARGPGASRPAPCNPLGGVPTQQCAPIARAGRRKWPNRVVAVHSASVSDPEDVRMERHPSRPRWPRPILDAGHECQRRSPGSLAGNPPPRWGAPGEDLAHGIRRERKRGRPHHVSRTVIDGAHHAPSVTSQTTVHTAYA